VKLISEPCGYRVLASREEQYKDAPQAGNVEWLDGIDRVWMARYYVPGAAHHHILLFLL
jgi:hypothetical protein